LGSIHVSTRDAIFADREGDLDRLGSPGNVIHRPQGRSGTIEDGGEGGGPIQPNAVYEVQIRWNAPSDRLAQAAREGHADWDGSPVIGPGAVGHATPRE